MYLAYAVTCLWPHVRAVLQLQLYELICLVLDASFILGRRAPNRMHLLDHLGTFLHVDLGLKLLKLGRL